MNWAEVILQCSTVLAIIGYGYCMYRIGVEKGTADTHQWYASDHDIGNNKKRN